MLVSMMQLHACVHDAATCLCPWCSYMLVSMVQLHACVHGAATCLCPWCSYMLVSMLQLHACVHGAATCLCPWCSGSDMKWGFEGCCVLRLRFVGKWCTHKFEWEHAHLYTQNLHHVIVHKCHALILMHACMHVCMPHHSTSPTTHQHKAADYEESLYLYHRRL